MFDKSYWIYILSSKRNGTLYVGVTNSLLRRIWDHKNGKVDGFTKKYQVNKLVFFEVHTTADLALKLDWIPVGVYPREGGGGNDTKLSKMSINRGNDEKTRYTKKSP